MRIALDVRKIDDYGIGTYIRGLLGGLSSLDFDHEIVLFCRSGSENRVPEDPRFKLVSDSSSNYSLRELLSIGSHLRRSSIDVFHAPHYVVPLTSRRVVVTIHDLIHFHVKLRSRHLLAPEYARWMIGRAVRNSRRILTVSNAVASEIAQRYPGAVSKIVVTPNGVHRRFFTAEEPELDSNALRGLGVAAQRYFLYVGNDKPHKNVAALVDAFGSIRERFPDLKLVLAGALSRFGSASNVLNAGFVSEEQLAVLYRSALASVVPSIHEGFGLPVAEAMAAGCPVIITPQTALIETAGGSAMIAEGMSAGEIAASMAILAETPALQEELSRKGRLNAARFSWTSTSQKTLEVYEEVLQMQKAGGGRSRNS